MACAARERFDTAYKTEWHRCLSIEMKSLRAVAITVILTSAFARGAEDVKLEPNALLRFDFPNLPETLASKFTGEKQAARLTAQLPDNYSASGDFPLFIFLHGGHGGHGDPHPPWRHRRGYDKCRASEQQAQPEPPHFGIFGELPVRLELASRHRSPISSLSRRADSWATVANRF